MVKSFVAYGVAEQMKVDYAAFMMHGVAADR